MATVDTQKYVENPLIFIAECFGLGVQKVLPNYATLLKECREKGDYSRMTLEMFEPFEKYKMLSWQQVEIVLAVKRAIEDKAPRKIAVRSGHGIGKSSVISMIIIWYLFAYYHAVIGCTAPTQTQMEDVLWKELSLWVNRLPNGIKEFFEHTRGYLRVGRDDKEKNAWYARAKTSSKENSEALAGLHSDHVMIIADEASGVEEQIFVTAMSARTSKDALFIMISNPTRLEGYFYKAFSNPDNFQTLNFNSEHSPLVDTTFVNEILSEYGKDSDEYRVRVQGEFPKAGLIDDKGWISLFSPNDITFVNKEESQLADYNLLGIDPSGSGKDFTSYVARNSFYARRVLRQNKSTSKEIALSTQQIKSELPKLVDDNIYYDNFGVGANVGQELAKCDIMAHGINVGEKADDTKIFLNKRAECYWRLKQEISLGLKLVGNAKEWSDLFMIKYKKTPDGRIKIMSKEEMRKEYGKSPDDADALALTFYKRTDAFKRQNKNKNKVIRDPYTGEVRSLDPYLTDNEKPNRRKIIEAW